VQSVGLTRQGSESQIAEWIAVQGRTLETVLSQCRSFGRKLVDHL